MVNLSRLRWRSNRQQARHLYDKPSRERHFLSIIGSALSVILIIMALAMREWARAGDELCDFTFGLTKVYVQKKSQRLEYGMSGYYKLGQQILISCILSVTVLTLLSSVVATIISAGYPRERMEFLRHYSVFNVLSLLCTVLVAGLWLAVVQKLPRGLNSIQKDLADCNLNIVSHFGYCYYILLVGGLFSLGGVSFNLLFARSAADRRRSVRHRFRQWQSGEAARLRGSSRDTITRALTQNNTVPPAYSLLDTSEFSDTDGETTEMSISEQSDEAEPISPPPPYAA